MKEKLKTNLKNNSNILLKVFLPELNLDWDDLYFYVNDKKTTTLDKIKGKSFYIKKK
jgi:hypothetical protein